MIFEVVAPVLHKKEYGEVPPLPVAIKVMPAPAQMLTVAGEMETVGGALTFTVLEVEAVHPLALVTVTE